MNKLKENILNYAKKGSGDTTNASNEITIATNHSSNETTSTTTPQDQMILMSMALV